MQHVPGTRKSNREHLAWMNERYAVVRIGGHSRVMNMEPDLPSRQPVDGKAELARFESALSATQLTGIPCWSNTSNFSASGASEAPRIKPRAGVTRFVDAVRPPGHENALRGPGAFFSWGIKQ
jgi:hypothetical protein